MILRHPEPDLPTIAGARLRRLAPFASLRERDLEEIARLARERIVPAGAIVFQDGDPSWELYVIEQGTARIVAQGCVLARLGAGDVVGERGPLHHTVRCASLVATSLLRLVALNAWDLRRLEAAAPAALAALRAAHGVRT